MKTLIPIDPASLKQRIERSDITLIDVREADEFAREHIRSAISLPLAKVIATGFAVDPSRDVAFYCRTGTRTRANCDQLAAAVDGPAFVLTGGLDAWKRAGLAAVANRKAPIEIMRQVQLAAGSLVLVGAVLAWAVDPAFVWLSAFIGAGLMVAGASGWCGMARLFALAPWNRRSV